LASGIVVGLSGVASGVLVIAANGWMNSPRGFRWVNGAAFEIDPIAAMFNRAWATEAVHMVIAAFVSTGFAAAGVHALRLLQNGPRALHLTGLRLALTMGAIAALLQPLSGDRSAKDVAQRQPAKLAAMEAHYHTESGAALVIGGIPDDAAREVHGAIEIPYALSFLAFGDPHAQVIGLDRIPRELWPPTRICHFAFQIMVGAGTALAGLGLLFLVLRARKPAWVESRFFLRSVALATPLGFIAVEAGWTVTEVGRQPWIIYGILRTRDAVSPMPGLVWPLSAIILVYALLSVITFAVMARLIQAIETGAPSKAATHG
jgi:cytochrome d ubiquinol oxidase subunit I